MSFLDHLDELRRRLLYCVVAIGAAFIVCFALSGYIYRFLAIPICQQINKAEAARRNLGGVSQPGALKEGDQIQYIFSQDTVVSGVKVPASTAVPARVVKKVVDGNEHQGVVTTQAIVVNGAVVPTGAEVPGVLGSTVATNASCEGGLVLTKVQGAFTLYMSVALYAALAFAIPFLLYQAWAFIAPGLYRHEKKYIGPVLAMASVFFAIGATFAYKIAFPAACDYLIGLQIEGGFRTLINAEDYLDLILIIMLGLGLVFQIPVIAFILGRVGLITPRMLWKSWRYAIVIIAIAAALLTPTADAMNMMIFAIPMLCLYGLSILIVWIFGKPRRSDSEVAALAHR